jgi:hypothetical protein
MAQVIAIQGRWIGAAVQGSSSHKFGTTEPKLGADGFAIGLHGVHAQSHLSGDLLVLHSRAYPQLGALVWVAANGIYSAAGGLHNTEICPQAPSPWIIPPQQGRWFSAGLATTQRSGGPLSQQPCGLSAGDSTESRRLGAGKPVLPLREGVRWLDSSSQRLRCLAVGPLPS